MRRILDSKREIFGKDRSLTIPAQRGDPAAFEMGSVLKFRALRAPGGAFRGGIAGIRRPIALNGSIVARFTGIARSPIILVYMQMQQ